jgi:hypothetical protein
MAKPTSKIPKGETPATDAPREAEPHRLTTASVQIGPTPSAPGSRLKKK